MAMFSRPIFVRAIFSAVTKFWKGGEGREEGEEEEEVTGRGERVTISLSLGMLDRANPLLPSRSVVGSRELAC